DGHVLPHEILVDESVVDEEGENVRADFALLLLWNRPKGALDGNFGNGLAIDSDRHGRDRRLYSRSWLRERRGHRDWRHGRGRLLARGHAGQQTREGNGQPGSGSGFHGFLLWGSRSQAEPGNELCVFVYFPCPAAGAGGVT